MLLIEPTNREEDWSPLGLGSNPISSIYQLCDLR